jgi:hypothetical protein
MNRRRVVLARTRTRTRTDEERSIALGQARADIVRVQLIKAGMAPDSVIAIGHARDTLERGNGRHVDLVIDCPRGTLPPVSSATLTRSERPRTRTRAPTSDQSCNPDSVQTALRRLVYALTPCGGVVPPLHLVTLDDRSQGIRVSHARCHAW